MRNIETDICVIGAGSGGLSVAAAAAQMGARVTLIERAEMGGDCLNFGCVPSKALIAAAKRAHVFRASAPFGVAPAEPEVDFAKVRAHVRETIAAIAPHDSQERFEGLGCTVIRAEARFLNDREIEAGDARVRAKRFVIATGSRAAIPPIPGLADCDYLTNETIFDNAVKPAHLAVLGGGPIGMEMAQAHARLGARVTVVEAARALGREDPELAQIALDAARADGVRIVEGVAAAKAAPAEGGGTRLTLADGETLDASHLLVATGRAPALEALNLDAAGVQYDRAGVKVDARLRAVGRSHIFAIGDAAGGLQFTHVAGWHAGIFIRNALFRLPAKAASPAIPRVTYLDPELAQVGLTEDDARAAGLEPKVMRAPFSGNDRARAERRVEGLLKAVVDRRGRVLGCGIVGAHAGELIFPWVRATAHHEKLSDIAGLIAPYPTFSEVSKRAAGDYYTPMLYGGRVKWVVKTLMRLLS